MGLKQTDEFLWGRHSFTSEDPPRGLADDLLYTRQDLCEALYEPLSCLFAAHAQGRIDPLRLALTLVDNGE
jgi:hypothetical protein